jgi:hypothetical protein
MQAVLNLVWDKLLPAFQPTVLAPDLDSAAKLATTLKGLSLRPQGGEGVPAKVVGKTFVFPANDRKLESVSIEPGTTDTTTVLDAKIGGVERRVVCERGGWQKGRAGWGLLAEQPVAASGGWAGETFTAKICFYETPFVVTIRLTFTGDEVRYETDSNVGFGPTKGTAIVGKVK